MFSWLSILRKRKDELSDFLGSRFMVYLEPQPTPISSAFWASRHQALSDEFQRYFEMPFFYLPSILKEGYLRDCLKYNSPYLSGVDSAVMQTAISAYSESVARANGIDLGDGGIALMDDGDGTTIVDFYPISSSGDMESQLDAFRQYLKENWIDGLRIQSSIISFQHTVSADKEYEFHQKMELYCNNELPVSNELLEEAELFDQFDTSGNGIAEDIRRNIGRLREMGLIKKLSELLLELQGAVPTMSRMVVTGDYRIFLRDWDNQEVVMRPLPKAVYLLFLQYPNGILLKELVDYRDEIRRIYLNITNRESIPDIEESIDALVNPLNNSINEKCSRIRSAFLEVVSPEMAAPYHITGKKGMPKLISLDRQLVVFEQHQTLH